MKTTVIFFFILGMSASLVFSQNAGKYWEHGANTAPPLTSFYDKQHQLDILQEIRDKVIANENGYRLLLEQVFVYADSALTLNCTDKWGEVCYIMYPKNGAGI